ncbi:DnaJ-domain-containing protein [Tricholoma matsutake]|nr:DnaJ-domain-containing protein [Tricholoma matsutake 945]
MFSFALLTASAYFHPVDEKEDPDLEQQKFLTWVAEGESSSSSSSSWSTLPSTSIHSPACEPDPDNSNATAILNHVFENDNLYEILGVSKSATLDRLTLRRAYLSRSRACHPDKFPNNPNATYAFQKVAVAYDILSKPSSKRLYDNHSPSTFDVFAARPSGHAEETFRSVLLGVLNDFLDGDLEFIKTLLKAINDISPSIKLGEDGINSVLTTLQAIRERALTCRTCIYALHNELSRLLELQYAFRQLSYFDIMGRSRLTIQLTRITLTLPIAVERAVRESQAYGQSDGQGKEKDLDKAVIFPRHVTMLIRGVDVVLDRMERILK